jgi:hypothetical protein
MYNALICNSNIVRESLIWKLKLPLKIKIFLWYLKKEVVLTNDNLIKQNWKGNKKCVFCSKNETIHHLFLECHFASFIWTTVQFTFGIAKPHSISHLFGDWLRGLQSSAKRLMFVGVAAICWVFDKGNVSSYVQALFRVTHWCRF